MKNAENRKQLDLNDRITIETGIYLKESFTSLAKKTLCAGPYPEWTPTAKNTISEIFAASLSATDL